MVIFTEAEKAKSLQFDRPITAAEIAAAPDWLKRIDGYDVDTLK